MKFEFPPPGIEPSDFSAAQEVLIEIAQAMSGLTDPVDALVFARAQTAMGERQQGRVIDEITAQVGRDTRNSILAAKAAELGVPVDKLRELLSNPSEYRALMRIKAQAHLDDVETAQEFLADHRRRTAERTEAAGDRWQLAFNYSKPSTGDRFRTDPLGKMFAAEKKSEKKAKAVLKRRRQDDRRLPKPPKKRKPPWKQKLAPGAKKAWLHFEQTGHGIVGDMVNLESGKTAEVLEADRQLQLWDEKRERESLDFAGWPWPEE